MSFQEIMMMSGMQEGDKNVIAQQQVLANTLIRGEGLVIDPVAGNGDCLFAAITQNISGTDFLQLRQRLCREGNNNMVQAATTSWWQVNGVKITDFLSSDGMDIPQHFDINNPRFINFMIDIYCRVMGGGDLYNIIVSSGGRDTYSGNPMVDFLPLIYGSDSEITILSTVLQRPITIYETNTRVEPTTLFTRTIDPSVTGSIMAEEPGLPIRIYLVGGNHFDNLIPIQNQDMVQEIVAEASYDNNKKRRAADYDPKIPVAREKGEVKDVTGFWEKIIRYMCNNSVNRETARAVLTEIQTCLHKILDSDEFANIGLNCLKIEGEFYQRLKDKEDLREKKEIITSTLKPFLDRASELLAEQRTTVGSVIQLQKELCSSLKLESTEKEDEMLAEFYKVIAVSDRVGEDLSCWDVNFDLVRDTMNIKYSFNLMSLLVFNTETWHDYLKNQGLSGEEIKLLIQIKFQETKVYLYDKYGVNDANVNELITVLEYFSNHKISEETFGKFLIVLETKKGIVCVKEAGPASFTNKSNTVEFEFSLDPNESENRTVGIIPEGLVRTFGSLIDDANTNEATLVYCSNYERVLRNRLVYRDGFTGQPQLRYIESTLTEQQLAEVVPIDERFAIVISDPFGPLIRDFEGEEGGRPGFGFELSNGRTLTAKAAAAKAPAKSAAAKALAAKAAANPYGKSAKAFLSPLSLDNSIKVVKNHHSMPALSERFQDLLRISGLNLEDLLDYYTRKVDDISSRRIIVSSLKQDPKITLCNTLLAIVGCKTDIGDNTYWLRALLEPVNRMKRIIMGNNRILQDEFLAGVQRGSISSSSISSSSISSSSNSNSSISSSSNSSSSISPRAIRDAEGFLFGQIREVLLNYCSFFSTGDRNCASASLNKLSSEDPKLKALLEVVAVYYNGYVGAGAYKVSPISKSSKYLLMLSLIFCADNYGMLGDRYTAFSSVCKDIIEGDLAKYLLRDGLNKEFLGLKDKLMILSRSSPELFGMLRIDLRIQENLDFFKTILETLGYDLTNNNYKFISTFTNNSKIYNNSRQLGNKSFYEYFTSILSEIDTIIRSRDAALELFVISVQELEKEGGIMELFRTLDTLNFKSEKQYEEEDLDRLSQDSYGSPSLDFNESFGSQDSDESSGSFRHVPGATAITIDRDSGTVAMKFADIFVDIWRALILREVYFPTLQVQRSSLSSTNSLQALPARAQGSSLLSPNEMMSSAPGLSSSSRNPVGRLEPIQAQSSSSSFSIGSILSPINTAFTNVFGQSSPSSSVMMSSPVENQNKPLSNRRLLPPIERFTRGDEVFYNLSTVQIQSINGNDALIMYQDGTTETVPLNRLTKKGGGTVKRKNRKILIKKTIRQNKKSNKGTKKHKKIMKHNKTRSNY